MTRRCSNPRRTQASKNLVSPLGNPNVPIIIFFMVIWTTVWRTKNWEKKWANCSKKAVACDSTEQANSYWTIQGIIRIYETSLYITVFTSSFHSFLSWARSIQPKLLSFSLKIHFSIIFPFAPWSSKCPLPQVSLTNLSTYFFSQIYVTRPFSSSSFDYPNSNWWGLQFMKLITMHSYWEQIPSRLSYFRGPLVYFVPIIM
jgi:hypothetical protein